MRLLQWLQDSWPDEIVSLPDIYQRGPRAIRDQSTARKMVQLLQEHGWLEHLPEGGEVAGTKRREVWRIVTP
jgi:DNA-binding IclR family transcriptional regulator